MLFQASSYQLINPACYTLHVKGRGTKPQKNKRIKIKIIIKNKRMKRKQQNWQACMHR